MTVAQVCGCKDDGESAVLGMVSNAEAEFFGVYLGQPGAFQHHVDKDTRDLAIKEAEQLVADGKASEIDDKTFDA